MEQTWSDLLMNSLEVLIQAALTGYKDQLGETTYFPTMVEMVYACKMLVWSGMEILH